MELTSYPLEVLELMELTSYPLFFGFLSKGIGLCIVTESVSLWKDPGLPLLQSG